MIDCHAHLKIYQLEIAFHYDYDGRLYAFFCLLVCFVLKPVFYQIGKV